MRRLKSFAPVVFLLAFTLALNVGSAFGYRIVPESGIKAAAGPQLNPTEVMVHRGVEGCFIGNYSDLIPYAYKIDGVVRLTIPHVVTTTMEGPSLTQLTSSCPPNNADLDRNTYVQNNPQGYAFKSDLSDYTKFLGGHWLASTYAVGSTVHAFYYTEWHATGQAEEQGSDLAEICPSEEDRNCLQLSAGYAQSSGGAQFVRPAAPSDPMAPLPYYVASLPYQYQPDWGQREGLPGRALGAAPGSNIFKKLKPGDQDPYYYAFIGVSRFGVHTGGPCLVRTDDLSQPSSWRAWNGSSFSVSFMDPYRSTDDPANHVCAGIARDALGGGAGTVTYNTVLGKYLMTGQGFVFDPALNSQTNPNGNRSGVWYSTSEDLINWAPRKMFIQQALRQDGFTATTPGDPNYPVDQCNTLLYATIMDPQSSGQNFEESGHDVQFFWKRRNRPNLNPLTDPPCGSMHQPPGQCSAAGSGCDRDVFRIPLTITKPPVASFTVSAGSVTGDSVTVSAPNNPVTFNAGTSIDPGGSIANYSWDLNGDGTYETDTGTTPTTSKTYTASNTGVVKVGLKVTDNSGATATAVKTVVVESHVNFQPPGPSATGPGGQPVYTSDIGNAFPSGPANARRYGWVTESSLSGTTHQPINLTSNARKRNVSADPRLDTLMWMQWPDNDPPNGAWEAEVPNGTYDVNLWAGDPAPITQQFSQDGINVSAANHRINVEQQNTIAQCIQSFAPIQCQGSTRVVVRDGRLTIDATGGGFNARINYVDITPVVLSAPQAGFTSTQPDTSVKTLKLDASDSTGRLVRYEWDLDGNGTYERDMGSRSVTWAFFTAAGTQTVGLRVTDSSGNIATTSQSVTVQ